MGDWTQDRLETRILQAVNTLIVNGDIKNPKLSHFASVSEVSLSKDNAYATLYISCLDEKALTNSVRALQSASGFIQARLAKALKTKNTPKLTFVEDTTEQYAQKINSLLEKANANK